MDIDEAIKILNYQIKMKDTDVYTPINYDAIKTIINEYNNLKQIEEAHRIENGQLRSQINNKEKDFAMQLLYNNIIGKKDGEEDCKRLVKELINYGGIICIKN